MHECVAAANIAIIEDAPNSFSPELWRARCRRDLAEERGPHLQEDRSAIYQTLLLNCWFMSYWLKMNELFLPNNASSVTAPKLCVSPNGFHPPTFLESSFWLPLAPDTGSLGRKGLSLLGGKLKHTVSSDHPLSRCFPCYLWNVWVSAEAILLCPGPGGGAWLCCRGSHRLTGPESEWKLSVTKGLVPAHAGPGSLEAAEGNWRLGSGPACVCLPDRLVTWSGRGSACLPAPVTTKS